MATDDPFNLTSDNRPVHPDNEDANQAPGGSTMGGSGASGTSSKNYPERSADSGLNQAIHQQQAQGPEPTIGSDAYTARGGSIGGYTADTGAGDRYAAPTPIPSGANGNATASGQLEDGSGGHGPTEADYEATGTSNSGEIVGGG